MNKIDLSAMKSAIDFLAQPIVWFFERVGMIKPTLVATWEVLVEWPDDDDEGVGEIITFFLFEHSVSKRRYHTVHAYGSAFDLDAEEMYVAQVLVWVYGGLLPAGAKLTRRSAEIVQLAEVPKKAEEQ